MAEMYIDARLLDIMTHSVLKILPQGPASLSHEPYKVEKIILCKFTNSNF